MIINFYLPETDSKIIEILKTVSDEQRRSFSFIVREALEHYLLNVQRMKAEDIHSPKEAKVS